jgi:hypothetical protein
MTKVFNAEKFEKDSLAIFEKLLQGYRKAEQSGVWESKMNSLVEKLTHLPTAPFPDSLMQLFDYNYLVLSEDINVIIEKALVIREQMQRTKRTVTIREKYFSLPLLPKNTYLKYIEIFNNEGELCYLSKGRMRFSFSKLIESLGNRKLHISNAISLKQKSYQYKELEIYYYSQFVDCSSTNETDYYDFFCDYYGKIQFAQYFTNKENLIISGENMKTQILADVVKFTSSQQVLWAYFFFGLLDLSFVVMLTLSF